MRPMAFRAPLGIFLLVSCSLLGSEEPSASSIARRIEQLGSAAFAEREKAEAELGKLATVPAELRRAARAADPEVQNRAKAAILRIESRGKPEKRQEIARLLREGRLDLALERTIAWKGIYASEDWSADFEALAVKLWDLQTKQEGYKPLPRKIDPTAFLDSLRTMRGEFRFVSSDKELGDFHRCTVARAPRIKAERTPIVECLLLSPGDVSIEGHDRSISSVVFSGGPSAYTSSSVSPSSSPMAMSSSVGPRSSPPLSSLGVT